MSFTKQTAPAWLDRDRPVISHDIAGTALTDAIAARELLFRRVTRSQNAVLSIEPLVADGSLFVPAARECALAIEEMQKSILVLDSGYSRPSEIAADLVPTLTPEQILRMEAVFYSRRSEAPAGTPTHLEMPPHLKSVPKTGLRYTDLTEKQRGIIDRMILYFYEGVETKILLREIDILRGFGSSSTIDLSDATYVAIQNPSSRVLRFRCPDNAVVRRLGASSLETRRRTLSEILRASGIADAVTADDAIADREVVWFPAERSAPPKSPTQKRDLGIALARACGLTLVATRSDRWTISRLKPLHPQKPTDVRAAAERAVPFPLIDWLRRLQVLLVKTDPRYGGQMERIVQDQTVWTRVVEDVSSRAATALRLSLAARNVATNKPIRLEDLSLTERNLAASLVLLRCLSFLWHLFNWDPATYYWSWLDRLTLVGRIEYPANQPKTLYLALSRILPDGRIAEGAGFMTDVGSRK